MAKDTDIKVAASVQNTSELLTKHLSIPIYQRPYVWTENNVE